MLIKGNNLSDDLVVENGKFAILWNCFERYQCNNNCNPSKIRSIYKNLSIDKAAQRELAKVLNERRSWFGQIISLYVETGLYPGNARQNNIDDRMAMGRFLEQNEEDLRHGCLLVIYRIRNDLMHGLKCIEQLNDQLTLIKAVNGVLESIYNAK